MDNQQAHPYYMGSPTEPTVQTYYRMTTDEVRSLVQAELNKTAVASRGRNDEYSNGLRDLLRKKIEENEAYMAACIAVGKLHKLEQEPYIQSVFRKKEAAQVEAALAMANVGGSQSEEVEQALAKLKAWEGIEEMNLGDERREAQEAEDALIMARGARIQAERKNDRDAIDVVMALRRG